MENENPQSPIGGTPPPTPPTPPEQPPAGQPETPPAEPDGEPGFGDLLKTSFQLFGKNWISLIKLTFIYLLPLIVIGGLIYFFVGGSNAAPQLPETETSTVEATAETPPSEDNMADIIEAIDENPEDNDIETEPAPESEGAEGEAGDTPTPTLFDEESEFELGTLIMDDGTELDMQFSGGGSGALMGMLGVAAGAMLGIMLLLMIPIWLYGAAAMLSHVKLAVLASQSAEIHIGELVKWGFKKIGSFIMLNIRIFIYTLAWVQFLISIATPYIMHPDVLGIYGAMIMPFVGIVMAIIVFIRSLRTYFSIYTLAEKDCSSKEALKDSISAAKGHLGKIFGYAFLYGLIFSVVPIAAMILVGSSYERVIAIIYFVIMLIAVYIGMFFFYGLYNICKMENASKAQV